MQSKQGLWHAILTHFRIKCDPQRLLKWRPEKYMLRYVHLCLPTVPKMVQDLPSRSFRAPGCSQRHNFYIIFPTFCTTCAHNLSRLVLDFKNHSNSELWASILCQSVASGPQKQSQSDSQLPSLSKPTKSIKSTCLDPLRQPNIFWRGPLNYMMIRRRNNKSIDR